MEGGQNSQVSAAHGHANHVPKLQTQLLLYKPRHSYEIYHRGEVPTLSLGELLVEILAIGLNPIDWKSAQYGFAIPALPCVNGREFVGRIVARNVDPSCKIENGELVLAISTDYRDFRKSAFQEYAVVCCFHAVRIPQVVNPYEVASIGVAFVAASISLGVCLGIDFPSFSQYPPLSLLSLARQQHRQHIPADVVEEIFDAISPESRPERGNWILIYGASSVTAQMCIQLAKFVGLKIIAVADASRHKARLEALGADVVIDKRDLDMASREIYNLARGSLRFALDMVGKETAGWCQTILHSCHASPYLSPDPSIAEGDFEMEDSQSKDSKSHLVCLTGEPEERVHTVRVHRVPIKLFHVNARLGSRLSKWLYCLLESGALKLPQTIFVDGGLNVINSCLDMLRRGEASGSRVVVRMDDR